jgi:membrane fusion protein (multidrug efflux system)
LALEEGQARLTDVRLQQKAIDDAIDAEQAAAEAYRRAGAVALEEQGARINEAEVRAKFAESHAGNLQRLLNTNAVSAEEALEAESEAQARRVAVQGLQVGATRLQEDQKVNLRDRDIRLAELRIEQAELTGQLAIQTAALRRLERECEMRQVRAPVSGRVGQVRDFPTGSFVSEGEALGFIVPPSQPRVVAYFPVSAAGRVQPGQQARLRLEGFPWIQYGKIPAVVVDVASEARHERIRVELQPTVDPELTIPVEHGLPGSVEVSVERISPAVLVLRTVGWSLSTSRSRWPHRDGLE